jgi:hypothetical protein
MDFGCEMALFTGVAKLLEEYMFRGLAECRRKIKG